MSQGKVKVPFWLIVFIVVFLFIALIVYIGSFGNVDLGVEGSLPKEFKEDRNKAQERHNKLFQLIEKQIEVRTLLERRFKVIYFGVRTLFVLLWIGLLFGGYFLGYIKDLEDILNYSEAILLIAFVLNFLCFGSLTNLQLTLQHIKNRLENWVYGKHISIQDQINKNQLELFQLKDSISKVNEPLSLVKTSEG
tara:strand:+ start:627 stop:1205 length:579 start_codon:yes stop_codon:yes gene_type:complete